MSRTLLRPLLRDPLQRRDAGIGLALFVASLALQWLLMNPLVGIYDEGLILYGSARVAHGGVPYRDFWSLYGPATYYILGSIFHFFGESVFNARVYDTLTRAFIVLFAFLNLRVYTSRSYALITALSVLGVLIALQQYEFPVYPATACSLFTIWVVTRSPRLLADRTAGLLAGFGAGLAVTFRTDLGVYVFLVCLYAISASCLVGPARFKTFRMSAFHVVCGGALVLLPVSLYLLLSVPLSDLYEDFVHIAFKIYAPNRSLPFPGLRTVFEESVSRRSLHSLQQLVVYVPFIVAAIGASIAISDRFDPTRDAQTNRASVEFEMLTVLLILFILKGLVRVSFLHMGPALIVSQLVGSLIVWRMRNALFRAGIALVALLCVSRLNGLPDRFAERRELLFDQPAQPRASTNLVGRLFGTDCHVNERLGCFKLDSNRAAVLSYLVAHVEPESFIYVGAGRHDKLFLNNTELYFLSGTQAPTKWFDLHPGVQTERPIQEEVIDSFKRHPPKLVVLNEEWDNYVEPNRSAQSSGVRLLDTAIRLNFSEVAKVGTYTMLESAVKSGRTKAPGNE